MREVTAITSHMGLDMASLSDIYWERHLVKIVDLREDTPMGCQVKSLMENLRDIQFESHLAKMVEGWPCLQDCL